MTATIILFPAPAAAATPSPLPPIPIVDNLLQAIDVWSTRSDAELVLRCAVKPPVDQVDDEVYDVALAVLFRDMVLRDRTTADRIVRLNTALTINNAQLQVMRSRAESEADQWTTMRLSRFCLRVAEWTLMLIDGQVSAVEAVR